MRVMNIARQLSQIGQNSNKTASISGQISKNE